jgi:hypothetical protein
MSKAIITILVLLCVGTIGYALLKMDNTLTIVNEGPGTTVPNSQSANTSIPVRSSGGGGGSVVQMPVLLTKIINLSVCKNPELPCEINNLTTTDINVYWQVSNGVGCCHSFGCNYELFTAFCGSPFVRPFKLYDIALDGVLFDWNTVNVSNYDYNYTCSNATVWNYFQYNNVSLGEHNVTIFQKDCKTVVDNTTIIFNITRVN